MPENLNFQPAAAPEQALDRLPSAEHRQTLQAYESFLNGPMGDVPEVAENREGILNAATELVDHFEVDESFTEQPGKLAIFTAIANRWSKAGEAEESERTFLADSLALLAHNNSSALSSVYTAARAEEAGYSDSYHEKVFEQYKNKQMTDELNVAIRGGLLGAIKERLGITAENEDAFEPIVLSISDSYALSGMNVRVGEWPQMDDPDYARKSQEVSEQLDLSQQAHQWGEDLIKRGEAFKEALGYEAVPVAWKTTLNGKTYLCMPQSFVEKILHPEEFVKEDGFYDQRAWESDFAVLEHEYTHTQGGLNVDNELAFGINLEELRAEHFSGDKNGYTDIKDFARDVGVVTGTDLAEFIAGKEKGGKQADIFTEMARAYGLDSMLEIVMAQPKPYLADTKNKLIKHTSEYLGSYDGIITRLIEATARAGQGQAMMDRVDARVRKLHEINPDFMATYFGMRRAHGAGVVTDLMETRAKELGLLPTAS